MTDKVIILSTRDITKGTIQNIATFSLLALCIYLSNGSVGWSLVSGAFFIFALYTAVAKTLSDGNRFYSKADLVKWANALEEWKDETSH